MKNTFFSLSDVSTRAAVVFKYAGVEQIKHRLMEEENEKWKSAQVQNRAKLHELKHKLTFTKTKLSAEWQRKINREKNTWKWAAKMSVFEFRWQYFTSIIVQFILLKLFFRKKQKRNVFIDLEEKRLK